MLKSLVWNSGREHVCVCACSERHSEDPRVLCGEWLPGEVCGAQRFLHPSRGTEQQLWTPLAIWSNLCPVQLSPRWGMCVIAKPFSLADRGTEGVFEPGVCSLIPPECGCYVGA